VIVLKSGQDRHRRGERMCEGIGPVFSEGTILASAWCDQGKTKKTSVRMDVEPGSIFSHYLIIL